jgi:catechol 2,3-dioxygenase-like lactoylglutathione lyase family enzyme
MEAIDHLDLVVSDFDRSLAFYTDLLRPLGYVRHGEIVGERGEKAVYINRVGGYGAVSIRQKQSDAHEVPYDRYAIGIHHICFSAVNRETVDDRARWLRENGHEIESGPEEYGYTPGYYAVFFPDPDGIKLEIMHRPRDSDLVTQVRRLERRIAELESGR